MDLDLKFNTNNTETIRFLQNQPNPFQTETSIDFLVTENQIVHLIIYNLQGNILKSINHEAVQGNNKIHLKLNELSPGIYFYEIETTDGRVTKKMLKL